MGKIVNQEAVEVVIGAMLFSKEAISEVTGILTKEDFATPQLREVFAAVLELFEEDKPVDIITVAERLRERGTFEEVGGNEYLTNLAINTPTTANVMYYAKIVKEKSLLRQIASKNKELTAVIEMGDLEAAKLIAEEITVLTEKKIGYNTIKALIISEAAEKDKQQGAHLWLVENFIPQKGLVIFSGRPKHGKTTVLL
ncbi:DnaB domain protein helicase, N-terminal domain protein [Caldicellulosiruptor saccharolyticus DSM 8903]|uniref:DnaB domain protein helicase, N-terminal domain protein n=1 Tax=Caldicellulosiruptor saccharolyticus (strain ATCC 43494 / DSM 8903 / Tp8T 6331) TaxID=351627 RepID=A4XL96_CALS8|nr:DnaB-like helicase N-terminal domain-containing protein [Caldicellulosiruptor saccharolyticus]ABP67681.1 DnaB domain protein helicase, N-terminal domain protein [Caldicellulosiruptor saccharolyticus DSM 8903]